jgi:pimeloyl-ACP methyl ester carboxylesterase
VKSCLGGVGSPAILVGHSDGGTLITHAGADPRVAGVVYIAALAQRCTGLWLAEPQARSFNELEQMQPAAVLLSFAI